MQPKIFFYTSFLVIVFTLALVLFARNSVPESKNPLATTAPLAQGAPPERTSEPAHRETTFTPTSKPTASPELSGQDGQSLLSDHCARCHTLSWLKQVKKDRGNWEKTLVKMEKFAGAMSESEKSTILDTLASIRAR